MSRRVILAMILAAVVHCIDENQRILHVSELISDDDDFFTNDNSHRLCCMYGNCSCNSLDHALANLTSNVLINITTDVTLSSLIERSDLQNVSIIGHNNPTVNCKSFGGLYFTFIHNFIMQGITWDGCGTEIPYNLTAPGLKLNYSSNVIIQNCCFQHSIGQALVLSEVSEDVDINNCNFVNNSNYRGHGAAIHYSYMYNTKKPSDEQFVFTINNCSFTNNKHIKSLVYIENRLLEYHKIFFNNSMFSTNQAIPVYVISHKIYVNGISIFQNNVAEDGAGIYISDHSTVIFDENSNVTFSQNLANGRGGAVFLTNHSICSFDQNSTVTFHYNKATTGGAIYSEDNSNVTFKETWKVIITSNLALQHGAAIYSLSNSNVIFAGNARTKFYGNVVPCCKKPFINSTLEEKFNIIFYNNTAATYGGAIYVENNCHISFGKTSTTMFSNNNAHYGGGAIYCYDNSYICFEGNSTTLLSNNTVDEIYRKGGAIFSYNNSHISFEGNSNTVLNNNSAYYGGGIFSYYSSNISFKESSVIEFSNNTAHFGGAIEAYDSSNVHFEGNSVTEFSDNTAGYYGGAIYSYGKSYLLFEGNSFTEFSGNTALHRGGAIRSYKYTYIFFEGNSVTKFRGNTAGNYGGGISSVDNSHISFQGNSSTQFSNNKVNLSGGISGAINSHNNSCISFEGDSFTVFNNNTAEYGGALCSTYESYVIFTADSFTEFSNNNGGAICSSINSYISFEGKSITVLSNNAASYGGAIFFERKSYINFKENSTAVFSNNIADKGGTILANNHCKVIIDYNSSVLFKSNSAVFGATIFCMHDSKLIVIGYSSITINDHTAKWCANVCLPSTGETDTVIIDSDGLVWCKNLKAFNCLSDKCYCKSLQLKLDNIKNNQIVNITDDVVVLSSIIKINSNMPSNISIIGHNNPTVICVNGSGLIISYCEDLVIKGITWIGCGATESVYAILTNIVPVLKITNSNNVIIQKCSFLYSMGRVIGLSELSGYVDVIKCAFVSNNHYRGHGTAIYSPVFNALTIINCEFTANKCAKSVIYIEQGRLFELNVIDIYLINSSFFNNEGVGIYVSNFLNLRISGKVLFENNVAEDGAGICISDHSTVIFDENSNIEFFNNTVQHSGAAIFLNNGSNAIFDKNSIAMFYNNKASNGIVCTKYSSSVRFKATSYVMFSRNLASQYGAAIYCFNNSQVVFTGNSTVTFKNNIISFHNTHLYHGGTILSQNNGSIIFEENSITVFTKNSADFGTAIFSIYNSNIIFKDGSRVMFNNNIAHYCGVLTSALFSNITFTNNTKVTYDTNIVSYILSSYDEFSAGSICTFKISQIIFSGHSLVLFINNKADAGAAVIFQESNVIIKEFSTVKFHSNVAFYSYGGAFVCSKNSNVTIAGNSYVTFNDNMASRSGGAIYSYNMCTITFQDNSRSTFANNIASSSGGAIFSSNLSEITFKGSSVVIFDGNIADNGGVFYFTNSTVIFKKLSLLLFYNNKALKSGGVGYFNFNSQVWFEGSITVKFYNNLGKQIAGVLYSVMSKILFKENSTITLTDNKATLNGGTFYFDNNSDVSFSEFTNITFHHNRAFYGGAILANNYSNITITGNSVLLFVSNEATQKGGAGYFNYNCKLVIKGNSVLKFGYNKALEGGAIYINDKTKFTIKGNATTSFYNNLATVSGGAVLILNESSVTLKDHISVKFTNNNAQYGGAMFLDATAVMDNNCYNICINFANNFAKVSGNSVYQDAFEFCNSNCVKDRLVGISSGFVDTPPNKLKFYDPAVCIDKDNDTQCNSYYVQDIMLGTEIVIPACVLDYYNQSIESTQFLVQSEIYSNYSINGPKHTLISCDTFKGISIMGNQSLSQLLNFSINITLNVALNSNWKPIIVNLIIELSPCHPGFWQHPKSKTCECYNASDIVFCSGSSSTIRRGYWFGIVTKKPTVTFCPINYCNFTCCETSIGYYHLSPVRNNQCRSHRSGAACGSCEEGYTLSFDSVKCVNANKCSIGWTILVLILVILYWIIIIAVVCTLMYFKVGIGYLYAIAYYYSVVDLLLNQNLHYSDTLYTTSNVMSSIAKIIPQFLGKLCFITNMSGIDQQFIHYIHPVAISLFLVMITVLARRSHRLSYFISRGIIHVICCLLLLSYTSLATTSLLLMRPLIFHGVNKVYTYVSPDIEYFHGRHLVYAIVAVSFTIVIVIGLPLLLALEPFLNSKVNFIKIKPLLDQFQGCYKDKYRCFSAYYMICRLLIITIILINSSNDLVFQYLLITVSMVMAIIHQLFRPYSSSMLNRFDGVILQLLILVSTLLLAEFHNNFDSSLIVGMIFILLILPSVLFITMSLIINKEKFQKLLGYCYFKCSQLHLRHHNEIPLYEVPLLTTEGLSNENGFFNIVDDSKRLNATICDV